MLLGNAMAMEV